MHKITLSPDGQTFDVEADESILTAALRAGLILPYGCKNGACGSCKGDILSGSVDYGVYQEKSLTAAEREQGKALFCQAKPLSDCTLKARLVGKVGDIQVKMMPGRIQTLEKVTDDVIVLHLKLPASQRLEFLAGQYLEFILKDGKRRSYSLANAPHVDEQVSLHIRHMPGGVFTDHVFAGMKERDILRFEGPLGSFFLREDSDKPIVLVASGTGFAPVKAIIEQAIHGKSGRPMTLYWGARRPGDLYMRALCEEWAATVPGFRFVAVVSDALPEDAWQGRTGFVHQAVMADFPDLSTFQVYACGAPIVVDSAQRDFVARCNLPADEFYADAFTSQADVADA